MKIQLTKEECLTHFHSALCNGLTMLPGYGLELQYSSKEYAASRKKFTDPCFEDVLIQMLKDGYTLSILDIEGNGDQNKTINIQDVYSRLPKTPLNHLSDMINENDDAYTADAIIQTVFYGELIFA